ncbi:MAG: hypothetical protein ACRDG5_00160 [Anaerolineales bacterium]
MTHFSLVSLEPASESAAGRRCDRLAFDLPDGFRATNTTLVVQRLAASLPHDPDWDGLRKMLAEVVPGLVIQPLLGAEGLSFALVQAPDGMTDLEAHNIVVGLAEPVVVGPWTILVDFDQ